MKKINCRIIYFSQDLTYKIVSFFLLLFTCIAVQAKVFVKKNGHWTPVPMSVSGYINEAYALGYKEGMYFTVQDWGETLDSNDKITAVTYKLFSTEIIHVQTEDEVSSITDEEVEEITDMVNGKLDNNNCVFMFDDLDKGIEKKTLTLSYISKCLSIPYNAKNANGVLVAPSRYNSMKLYFKNGYLTSYTSQEGYTPNTMRKKPEIIEDFVSYFKVDHPNMTQKEIVAAINLQTKYSNHIAIKLLVDDELKNKFRLNNKALNYALFALYGGKVSCSLNEFKKMTYNMEEDQGTMTISGIPYRVYRCMDCYFYFKPNGQLHKVM